MKSYIIVLFILGHFFSSYAQNRPTLTYQLVTDFHKAWNEENLEGMKMLLDEDAFFKSPFQLRYSRETMMETVLLTIPKAFKVIKITETHSKIKDNLAWSIGKMVSNVYDEDGNKEEEQWLNDYVYLFVKTEKGDWKLQMMLFHE